VAKPITIDILDNDDVKTILSKIERTYINKLLDGRIRSIPWWNLESEEPVIRNNFYELQKKEDYCSYERYLELKDKPLEETNYAHPFKCLKRPRIGALHSRKDYFYDNFYNDLIPLLEPYVKSFVGDYYSQNKLVESNAPMWYTNVEDVNGFMGWHTNCNNPGWRFYLVYNPDENTSFFRYIKNNEMVTEWEPQGWILNGFYASDCDNPLWHCIYTKTNRFSFGLRIDDEEWIDRGFDRGKMDALIDLKSWR